MILGTPGSTLLRQLASGGQVCSYIDIVIVAELLGHSLETARRYALPTRKDREDAIARLTGDA